MSWRNEIDAGVEYQVCLKSIDSKITPQNRLILCKALDRGTGNSEKEAIAKAHAPLELAYGKAHKKKDSELSEDEKIKIIHYRCKEEAYVKELGIWMYMRLYSIACHVLT